MQWPKRHIYESTCPWKIRICVFCTRRITKRELCKKIDYVMGSAVFIICGDLKVIGESSHWSINKKDWERSPFKYGKVICALDDIRISVRTIFLPIKRRFRFKLSSPGKSSFWVCKIWYSHLLHIMCGYQCDKAVNKNDTREVIWYHFTSEMISNHFTGLNCPIK